MTETPRFSRREILKGLLSTAAGSAIGKKEVHASTPDEKVWEFPPALDAIETERIVEKARRYLHSSEAGRVLTGGTDDEIFQLFDTIPSHPSYAASGSLKGTRFDPLPSIIKNFPALQLVSDGKGGILIGNLNTGKRGTLEAGGANGFYVSFVGHNGIDERRLITNAHVASDLVPNEAHKYETLQANGIDVASIKVPIILNDLPNLPLRWDIAEKNKDLAGELVHICAYDPDEPGDEFSVKILSGMAVPVTPPILSWLNKNLAEQEGVPARDEGVIMQFSKRYLNSFLVRVPVGHVERSASFDYSSGRFSVAAPGNGTSGAPVHRWDDATSSYKLVGINWGGIMIRHPRTKELYAFAIIHGPEVVNRGIDLSEQSFPKPPEPNELNP